MPKARKLLSGIAATAVLSLLVSVSSSAVADVRLPGLASPSSGGLEALDRSLARLSSNRRLLVVGAHPDDEDNALLTHVSRDLGGEAAYLSLSRGEGGQNLIGRELGVELGVVRTGELLAARRIEAARQYFTRARDFGYTRSLEETFHRWPRDELRLDALRVGRRFRPQVVVSVFPESERARHGQHQAAAVIARDIYELAGDSSAASVLKEEGVEPWRPQALYRRAWGAGESTIRYRLDSLDRISGHSLGQLAAASRSQHRSQDMGRERLIGRYTGGLVWLAGGAGEDGDDVFAGIDTRLASVASTVDEGEARSRIESLLTEVESDSRELRRNLAAVGSGEELGRLAGLVARLAEAEALARTARAVGAAELVAEKREHAEVALVAAAGVMMDATCSREEVAVGGKARVEVELWPAGGHQVEVVDVEIESEADWMVGVVEHLGRDEETDVDRWGSEIRVPGDADSTEPYFLRRPLRGDLYDWSESPTTWRGSAFEPAPLTAVVTLRIAGVNVRLRREIVHRYADQALGEIRRPVRAVPPIDVAIRPALVLWPRGKKQQETLEIVLRSNSEVPLRGKLEIDVPVGWRARGSGAFEISEPLGAVVEQLELLPADDMQPGRKSVAVRATLEDGTAWGASFPVIEYPHFAPTQVGADAVVEISAFDLETPTGLRVGYVPGAADRVPELLAAVGVPVTLLGADDLGIGDLSVFDVIVVGSRAYETDATLRRANRRLVDFVHRGGTLIVQYQQYEFVRGKYSPLALEIARPHGRITDEDAPVEVLVREHPVFNFPNRIDADDWSGWVQERGLYFAAEWDERLVPLLSMEDDGREPEEGALLIGALGEGTFVYTGLSFFRQLPAGVPGAIRLFVNLLSLGAAP